MKKFLALLLVAVICLSLIACDVGDNSAKNEIVGEWISIESGYSITFEENGKGLQHDFKDYKLTWKYNNKLSSYTVNITGLDTQSTKIDTTDYGARYISLNGHKFYHPDSYDKVLEVELAEEREFINESIIKNRTKIEFGKIYDCEKGLSIKFTGATIDDSDGMFRLILNAQITNPTSDGKGPPSMRGAEIYGVIRASGREDPVLNTMWSYNGAPLTKTVLASETLDVTLFVSNASRPWQMPNDKNMTYYYIYFTMNGVDYYIDMVEYFKQNQ